MVKVKVGPHSILCRHCVWSYDSAPDLDSVVLVDVSFRLTCYAIAVLLRVYFVYRIGLILLSVYIWVPEDARVFYAVTCQERILYTTSLSFTK